MKKSKKRKDGETEQAALLWRLKVDAEETRQANFEAWETMRLLEETSEPYDAVWFPDLPEPHL